MLIGIDLKRYENSVWYVFPGRNAVRLDTHIEPDKRGIYSVEVRGGELFVMSNRNREGTYIHTLFVADPSRGLDRRKVLDTEELKEFCEKNKLTITNILNDSSS